MTATELLDASPAGDDRTEDGLRANVNIGIQYISSWLRGNGAAGDLQPHGGRRDGGDLALAGVAVDAPRRDADDSRDGHRRARAAARDEELEKIREFIGDDEWFETQGRPKLSRELFERVALADEFLQFLTIPAYDELTD